MSPQLRQSIQNFLTDYQKKLTELSKLGLGGYEWDDSNDWLEKAVYFLQHAVVEDYKIPEDTNWIYTKPIVGIDDEGKPMVIDSWDNKVNRSINNK